MELRGIGNRRREDEGRLDFLGVVQPGRLALLADRRQSEVGGEQARPSFNIEWQVGL